MSVNISDSVVFIIILWSLLYVRGCKCEYVHKHLTTSPPTLVAVARQSCDRQSLLSRASASEHLIAYLIFGHL
jgi:hypothetical protein